MREEPLVHLDVVHDLAGDAVAAGYDRGVILSFDLGESWNEMNLGLPEKPVNRLTFDRRGHLLASIPGRGVFKTNEAVPTLSNPDPLPGSFATVDVYPNPAQSFVRFSFRLPVRTTVSLSVFDLLGRETAILLQNQTLAAGPHHAVWDAGGMAPGIYLFSLSGESILGRGAVVIN